MLGELFDPQRDRLVYEHYRPHWAQAGTVVFITFHTHDSLPREVLARWAREKQAWLRQHGWNGAGHWSEFVAELSPADRAAFDKTFNRCREDFLDSGYGPCWLQRPELAGIVAESLLHFDGVRYHMGDFIVMPNHVHLLAAFPTAEAMKAQCASWLHYTAHRIHRAIGETGKFWQQEPFDHLVRNLGQYEALRQYIADNPRKAGLTPGTYLYHRSTRDPT